MKKETIGILFVCLTLVVGGMFALWITTAPADGEDWIYLEPIIENTTTNITIEHIGTNATVVPTWGQWPNQFLTVKDKETLLDNFDTVYIMASWTQIYMDVLYGEEFRHAYTWWKVDFFLFATEGNLLIGIHETLFITKMPVANFFNWDITQTDDQTTYTFHYPKIIGWEDP